MSTEVGHLTWRCANVCELETASSMAVLPHGSAGWPFTCFTTKLRKELSYLELHEIGGGWG